METTLINDASVDEPSTAPLFEEVIERAVEIVTNAATNDWGTISALSELPDAVFIKNAEGVIVEANHACVQNFSPDSSPIGRNSARFLDSTINGVSEHTDWLIVNGANYLECEYVGRDANGVAHLMRTHKRNLAPLGNPGLSILGISRCGKAIDLNDAHPRVRLAEQHKRFLELDESDREICRQLAIGKKVREIADGLSLTSRAVEQRKKKILDSFGLAQTLDLIKLLVRLQDGGFVDLGL